MRPRLTVHIFFPTPTTSQDYEKDSNTCVIAIHGKQRRVGVPFEQLRSPLRQHERCQIWVEERGSAASPRGRGSIVASGSSPHRTQRTPASWVGPCSVVARLDGFRGYLVRAEEDGGSAVNAKRFRVEASKVETDLAFWGLFFGGETRSVGNRRSVVEGGRVMGAVNAFFVGKLIVQLASASGGALHKLLA